MSGLSSCIMDVCALLMNIKYENPKNVDTLKVMEWKCVKSYACFICV